MSDPVELALISAGVALIPSILSFISLMVNRKTQKAVEEVRDNVEVVEKATNSMKDELVKVTGEAKFAEGVKSEQDKQK